MPIIFRRLFDTFILCERRRATSEIGFMRHNHDGDIIIAEASMKSRADMAARHQQAAPQPDIYRMPTAPRQQFRTHW